ncbi:solute carrier family 4 (anion exchanger), member 1, adaptor protein [Nesidiocoris tenuis]|uniref:Solute carrier family 4 (Anion exchanger), member 1, adaptor protein n=1 Tax=Nesidiocoris tenuis TaxID=355587 RepID=A0ABN7A568_9HEMI|nr:solute carrier family 4 (anion exchanger), member 1, adaptor protein [Nesidiocoris tenuis]
MDCSDDYGGEDLLETGDDGSSAFKKPVISHAAIRKNILQTHMKKNMGFVQGGILTTVSSSESGSEKPADASRAEPPEKKASSQVPPSLKYDEPDWAGIPEDNYFLEEIKSGVVEKTIPLKGKSCFTFGRLESCDIPMAHPTVSRYHAVLQYRSEPSGEDGPGFYLYDLGSTHGTFMNKYRIKSKIHGRIKVGHMIKIGCSTRFFILQGPDEDAEEESSLTFSELKKKREEELEARKLLEEKAKEEEELEKKRQEQLLEEKGISWGMGEDADEETDLSVNPYAVVTNEELYIDDPKKALRLWFEREGEELEYEIDKAEKGMFVCKVVLPVDGEDGRDVTVETSGRNKKEAQVQCALEACRALDKLGVFRPSKRESKKAKKRNWEENDYYDSDEDSFLDRTGDLEQKRKCRMEKAGKVGKAVETYESLQVKYSEVIRDLEKAERLLVDLTAKASRAEESTNEDCDELDAFMANLKKNVPSKAQLKAAQGEVEMLKKEESRLRQLVNIAKPASLPELKPPAPPQPVIRQVSETTFVKAQEIKPKDGSKESKVVGPGGPPPPNPSLPDSTTSEFARPAMVAPRQKKVKPKKVAEDDFEDLVWRPPSGQTGDGRTSLNDKLGY